MNECVIEAGIDVGYSEDKLSLNGFHGTSVKMTRNTSNNLIFFRTSECLFDMISFGLCKLQLGLKKLVLIGLFDLR